MPPRRNSNNRRPRRPNRRRRSPNSGFAQHQPYRGPVTPPQRSLSLRNRRTEFLRLEATITSTAGGVISPIYTSADPRTLANDFSNLAATYSEYCTVAIHIQFTPIVADATNNVLIFGLPASTAMQTGSLSAAASYASLLGSASVRKWSLNRRFSFTARAIGSDEEGFVPIGSDPATADTFCIKTYADTGYAATTTYGTMLVTYTIIFQTRS